MSNLVRGSVWEKERRECIEAAAQQIFESISGRAGLDMSTLDEAVQDEIKADIYEILDQGWP